MILPPMPPPPLLVPPQMIACGGRFALVCYALAAVIQIVTLVFLVGADLLDRWRRRRPP